MSRLYESIKKIIESGMYDRAELASKIERLGTAERLFEGEAETLIEMMGSGENE